MWGVRQLPLLHEVMRPVGYVFCLYCIDNNMEDPEPSRERIWFKDPRGFLSDDRLAHFLPEKNTTFAVQLNALLRLAIYTSVIMILFRRYSLAIYIPVGVAGLTYALYVSNLPEEKTFGSSTDKVTENMTREGGTCTVPTHSNPYMNLLPFSQESDPPAACDISSKQTGLRSESCFDDNLYRDVDDVFHRRSSSHPFYTMPNTQITNDQGGFARWCYGTEPTFKEGGISYRVSDELQDNAGSSA